MAGTTKTEAKHCVCNYRQQWHGKRGKPSSEHQNGRRKRWYEQIYHVDGKSVTVRKATPQRAGCRLATEKDYAKAA